MNNSFLSELSKFDKRRLKPTLTKITYADGKAFLRKKDAYNEEKEILTEIDTNEQQTEDQTGSIYWSRNLGYLVDLVEDLSIDEIIPRLYLSGDDVVTKRDILRNKNITHVLNLTTNVCNVFESEISYKRIFIADFPEQKINEYFSETFEFIDNALINETNSVLVHCNAGISRSSSFVIAYLIQKGTHKTYQQAYEFVKSKRSKICPNSGFVNQLISLQKSISRV